LCRDRVVCEDHWGMAFLAVSVACGQLLAHVARYIQNSASEVRRGSRAPLQFVRVYRSNVPENTVTLATEFVRTRKLPLQFPGNKVFFVPELCNPWVRNSALNQSAWSRPVARQHRLPYNKDANSR
jgi:hypothetical protein